MLLRVVSLTIGIIGFYLMLKGAVTFNMKLALQGAVIGGGFTFILSRLLK